MKARLRCKLLKVGGNAEVADRNFSLLNSRLGHAGLKMVTDNKAIKEMKLIILKVIII